MTLRRWDAIAPVPDEAATRLVEETTGWPATVAAASPLCWAGAIMGGVHTAIADPEWHIDLGSLRRLREAAVRLLDDRPTAGSLPVVTSLERVIGYGVHAGLVLEVAVGSAASARLLVLAQGAGLPPGGVPEATEPAPRAAGEGRSRTVAVDTGQVERFTRWSGDTTPFHLDIDAARAAGLPGPIAPGMWVLGVLASAAAGWSNRAVDAVGAHFTRPTVIGTALAVSAGPAREAEHVALSAAGHDGPVVRHAWARLAP